MGSAVDGGELNSESGIVQRVAHHLFTYMADAAKRGTECKLSCSFMEIYNEEIKDLLDPSAAKTVTVRENADGGQTVSGVQAVPVTDAAGLGEVLSTGAASRSVGATKMNAQSSRSHAVFTIAMEQRRVGEEGEEEGDVPAFTAAKLHLVDLAGSERQKKTQASGARLREASFINKGLLALGNVINALATKAEGGPTRHVPYRDSKLTRLLQDSLGGNAVTLMIAAISPADSNFDETLNTLRYAQRARSIQNKAVVNTDPHTAQVVALQRQVRQLQMALLGAGRGAAAASSTFALTSADACAGAGEASAGGMVDTDALTAALGRAAAAEQRVGELSAELAAARSALHAASDEANRLTDELVAAQTERDEAQWKYEMAVHVTLPMAAAADTKPKSAEESVPDVLRSRNARIAELEAALARATREIEQAAGRGATRDVAAAGPRPPTASSTGPSRTTHAARRPTASAAGPEAQGEGAQAEVPAQADDGGVDEEEAAHMSRQASMRAELSAISDLLAEKEKLLRSVSASGAGMTSLGSVPGPSAEHDAKVAALEAEVTSLQERLQAAEAVAAKAGATPTAISQTATAALKRSLAAKEAALTQLRSRVQDTGRLQRLKAKADRRAEDLAREIQNVKAARVALLRRLKEDSARFKQASAARKREVASLTKARARTANELAKLKSVHEKQAAVLRRKTEELLSAHRSMREAAAKARSSSRTAAGSGGAGMAHGRDAGGAGAPAADPQVAALLSCEDVTAVKLLTTVPAPGQTLAGALAHASVRRVPPSVRVALTGEISLRVALSSSKDLLGELLAKRKELAAEAKAARARAAVGSLTARQRAKREAEAARAGRTLEAEVAEAEAEAAEAAAGAQALTHQIADLQDSISALDEAVSTGVCVAPTAPAGAGDGKKWSALLSDERSAKRTVWWLANVLVEFAKGTAADQAEMEQATTDALAQATEAEAAADAARREALTAQQRASAAERSAEERVLFWMQHHGAAMAAGLQEDEEGGAGEGADTSASSSMPSLDEISQAMGQGAGRGTPSKALSPHRSSTANLRSLIAAQQKELAAAASLHEAVASLEGERSDLQLALADAQAELKQAAAREASVRATAVELRSALDKATEGGDASRAAAAAAAAGSAAAGSATTTGRTSTGGKGKRSRGGGASTSAADGVVYYDADDFAWDSEASEGPGDDDSDDSDWEAGERVKVKATGVTTRRRAKAKKASLESTTGGKGSSKSRPGARGPGTASGRRPGTAGDPPKPRPATHSQGSKGDARLGGRKRPALGSVSSNTPATRAPGSKVARGGASHTSPASKTLSSKGRTSFIATSRSGSASTKPGRSLYAAASRKGATGGRRLGSTASKML